MRVLRLKTVNRALPAPLAWVKLKPNSMPPMALSLPQSISRIKPQTLKLNIISLNKPYWMPWHQQARIQLLSSTPKPMNKKNHARTTTPQTTYSTNHHCCASFAPHSFVVNLRCIYCFAEWMGMAHHHKNKTHNNHPLGVLAMYGTWCTHKTTDNYL